MKRLALLIAVAAVTVAGCQSSTGGTVKTKAPATTSAAAAAQPSSQAAAPSSAAPVPSPAPAAPTQFGADQAFTYTDGLAVSVLSAKKFTPSAEAAGTVAGDAAVALQIRITNGTKVVFDPTLVQVAVHAGPNGDQGSQIVDVGGAVNLTEFQGSIPAGQSATATLGFDVPAGDLAGILTVVVTPDFNHDDATLTGQVTS